MGGAGGRRFVAVVDDGGVADNFAVRYVVVVVDRVVGVIGAIYLVVLAVDIVGDVGDVGGVVAVYVRSSVGRDGGHWNLNGSCTGRW